MGISNGISGSSSLKGVTGGDWGIDGESPKVRTIVKRRENAIEKRCEWRIEIEEENRGKFGVGETGLVNGQFAVEEMADVGDGR